MLATIGDTIGRVDAASAALGRAATHLLPWGLITIAAQRVHDHFDGSPLELIQFLDQHAAA